MFVLQKLFSKPNSTVTPQTTGILKLEHKLIKSSDGTEIYAEAGGDYTKPHIVFLHGFACTSTFFDRLFALKEMRENLYLVCPTLVSPGPSPIFSVDSY
jgi:pimeloyl-ACP methyl ester carboxylesterase